MYTWQDKTAYWDGEPITKLIHVSVKSTPEQQAIINQIFKPNTVNCYSNSASEGITNGSKIETTTPRRN